jgi:hypothetical protein
MTISNNYINNFAASNEQNLIDELTRECIQFYGVDNIYLPRAFVSEDRLLGEDTINQFNEGFELEMLIENVDSFSGEQDIISKFGYEVNDEITFAVSKTSFEISTDLPVPQEGDLVYFPLSNGVFEIKFVEDENPFYQSGKLYQYKLVCQLFQYSHETLDTGIEQIDSLEDESAYSIDLQLGEGSGTFIAGEFAWQGETMETPNAIGKISLVDNVKKIIRLNNIVGDFILNSPIKGGTNGAEYLLSEQTDFTTDTYANNDVIEKEADEILDFTESNPFGEI